MLKFLIIPLLVISTNIFANQGDRYYSEVQNAKDMVTQSLNAPALKSLNAEDYCADENCKAQIKNPTQSAYFGDAGKMTDDGIISLANDPNAINLTDGHQNRPKYDLDPNDPDLQRAKGVMDDSYNITHGISSKYHDCEGGNVCTINPVELSCETPTNNTLSCYLLPVATVKVFPIFYTCPSGWNLDGNVCRKEVNQCRYDNRNRVKTTSAGAFGDSVFCGTDYKWDGNRVNSGKYWTGAIKRGSYIDSACGRNARSSEREICTLVPQQMSAIQTCSAGYTLSGGQCLINVISWMNNCPVMPTECTPKAPVCTEGAATKTINGIPTYLSCWKNRIDYQCALTNSCEPLLNPSTKTATSVLASKTFKSPPLKASTPEISNCVQKKETCGLSILGICLSNDVILECDKRTCEDRDLVCGEVSFCLDGECYEGEGEQSENAAESLAGLAALGQVAEDFSEDNVQIFTGKAASCDKKPIGLSDCCSDDGWGNDIGLSECSAEEKGLLQAKEDGLTIELGEYCAEKVLGVCIRKKKSYCQFDSKMARIIQEQGKVQLGLDFGTKEEPVCTGITPEQMQFLDFSTIDFSDFYEDMENDMELPDMELIQDSIKDKFTDM